MREDEDRRGSLAWINWPYFTVELVTRGYSDQEIKGIIGGNFVNILNNVTG
jgi:membrane dipeptidase